MPAIIVTEPGDTLAPFTAAVAPAALQDFTLQGRANALIQCVGTQPWEISSDNVNFFAVAAGQAIMLPILVGEGNTRGWYCRRSGAVDSVISVMVVG